MSDQIQFEYQRLEETISLAKNRLEQARRSNEKARLDIIESKREMRENSVHSVGNLWSSEGMEDLAALSQYVNPIMLKIADYEETENKIALLERLVQSPYFARIDFKYEGEEQFEKIYIGRASLMREGTYEIYVFDWRSPVASVFYRFVTGEAYYDAPNGRITGEVNLKRQYEISNGKMEYFFDSDLEIVDEFLRKMLSQNTSPKMKTIVETIQKEQDIIIRDMGNELMMVQGVAGSGKTSIALHRAAYLMYQGLSSKLSADNILIISPNTLFEQYISNVLPELGEESIVSEVFEDMLVKILRQKKIQTRNQFLEILITNSGYQNIMKSSIEFKMSCQFTEILKRLLEKLPKNTAGFEREYNIKDIYRELFNNEKYFQSLAKGIELPECIEDILKYTRYNLAVHTVYYDDAAALAFLNLKLNGNNISEYKNIKQVVIDEAQDYYPLHYEIFYLLFPRAKYTILGDINQTLEKQEDLSFYEQISGILNKKKSILVTMDKSFRCTNEILNFSSQFISNGIEIKSFNREGCKPGVFGAKDMNALGEMIISEVELCLKAGYRSIGLICKNKKNTVSLFEQLKDKMDIQMIKEGSTEDVRGVFIIPVYMSKGLEFDAVLICDADHENYNSQEDKKLIYIACTRALHRLNLFYTGKSCSFPEKPKV